MQIFAERCMLFCIWTVRVRRNRIFTRSPFTVFRCFFVHPAQFHILRSPCLLFLRKTKKFSTGCWKPCGNSNDLGQKSEFSTGKTIQNCGKLRDREKFAFVGNRLKIENDVFSKNILTRNSADYLCIFVKNRFSRREMPKRKKAARIIPERPRRGQPPAW